MTLYYVSCMQWQIGNILKDKGELSMAVRKIRSDCRVGTLEKTRGLPPGSIRNPNGKDARSDKKIGTLRRDYERAK